MSNPRARQKRSGKSVSERIAEATKGESGVGRKRKKSSRRTDSIIPQRTSQKRRRATKKPKVTQTESTRKPANKLPEVEKKTETQRRQDADRKGPVGKTRITDDKGTKRFLERDKLRKTAREATTVGTNTKDTGFKVEKPPMVKSAADSLREGTARSVAEAKRKGLDTFTNVRGDEKAAVTKEELKASGMSLRDYLNKQQGKTRRGMKKGGAVKKPFKTGDLVKAKPKAKKKVRGAGKEIKGLRPCKMR